MSEDEVIGIVHQAGWPERDVERLRAAFRDLPAEEVRLVIRRGGKTVLRVPKAIARKLWEAGFE